MRTACGSRAFNMAVLNVRNKLPADVLRVRSKLASLFGMDRASHQGGNESLTYTAPKEPKKSKNFCHLLPVVVVI